MPTYALFPVQDHLRRADGVGFGLVNAADASAARARFAQLMGEPVTAFAEWGAVDVTSLGQPVAIQGRPVGGRNQTVWPQIDRGGSYLRGN